MKKALTISAILMAGVLAFSGCKNKADDEFVDLGLPSGTLWKISNTKIFCTYDEALQAIGGQLPTKEQFEELISQCDWTWLDSGGYLVKGKNGNSISLPANGQKYGDEVADARGVGAYWSRTTKGEGELVYYMEFTSERHEIDWTGKSGPFQCSLRLVK